MRVRAYFVYDQTSRTYPCSSMTHYDYFYSFDDDARTRVVTVQFISKSVVRFSPDVGHLSAYTHDDVRG